MITEEEDELGPSERPEGCRQGPVDDHQEGTPSNGLLGEHFQSTQGG